MVYSAEQEEIIKAIYVYVTQRTGERKLIITDSLRTLMAVDDSDSDIFQSLHYNFRIKRDSFPISILDYFETFEEI
jgi:hypothetical protein